MTDVRKGGDAALFLNAMNAMGGCSPAPSAALVASSTPAPASAYFDNTDRDDVLCMANSKMLRKLAIRHAQARLNIWHSATPSTTPRWTPKPTMRRVHWSITTSTQCVWRTAADLELKLLEFQRYFNGHRAHAGLGGLTPEPRTGEDSARASVRKYGWRPHCRGLYQTPIAA